MAITDDISRITFKMIDKCPLFKFRGESHKVVFNLACCIPEPRLNLRECFDFQIAGWLQIADDGMVLSFVKY